jgi:hypothetical protein
MVISGGLLFSRLSGTPEHPHAHEALLFHGCFTKRENRYCVDGRSLRWDKVEVEADERLVELTRNPLFTNRNVSHGKESLVRRLSVSFSFYL